jgi:hypothetical protein
MAIGDWPPPTTPAKARSIAVRESSRTEARDYVRRVLFLLAGQRHAMNMDADLHR